MTIVGPNPTTTREKSMAIETESLQEPASGVGDPHFVGFDGSYRFADMRAGYDALDVAMLVKDLFELQQGRRASAVLGAIAAELEPIVRDDRVARARELLAEADGLEARIRAGEAEAVRRGARIALEVESSLRELAAATKERAR